MPCDTVRRKITIDRVLGTTRDQTQAERNTEIKAALATLEAKLETGDVSVVLSADGAVCFEGWTAEQRDGVTDVCAVLSLRAEGSDALTRAIMAAEGMSGNRYNAEAVASGLHSHDGGSTWGRG